VTPKEDIVDPLRQLARMDERVTKSKPMSDALAAALAGGKTLEAAAKSVGLTAAKVDGLTRQRPDPRLSGAPEFVGALFGVTPGKVVGPVRGINGWYFGRLDQLAPADTASYSKLKGAVTTDLLQRRQQEFMVGYLSDVRRRTKVEDHRASLQGN
jgi:hypothetical protein